MDTRQNALSISFLKIVTLGEHRSPSAYRHALRAAGVTLGDAASFILDRVSIEPRPGRVRVFQTSAERLGLPQGATFADLCSIAATRGFAVCPGEVGPALRLAMAKRFSPGLEYRIAMRPVADGLGQPRIFLVGCRGGSSLDAPLGCLESVIRNRSRFVFARPPKLSAPLAQSGQ
jgi:hypothetical protein